MTSYLVGTGTWATVVETVSKALDCVGFWFEPMQLREGSFQASRPSCPIHPNQRVHRHGFYERFEDCDSQRRSRIERFVCPRCGRTLSVLPKNRLPYIAVNTTILESDFDARASGTDPPVRTEKERGCLRRAFERFAGRVAPLCALLGQMIRRIKPSVSEWGLRQLDNLEGILLLLATKFKTSLLADYRCLQPGF
jgi:hypothetical protein